MARPRRIRGSGEPMRPHLRSRVAALAVGALSLAPVPAWAGGAVVIRVNPAPRPTTIVAPPGSVVVVPPGTRVIVVPPLRHRRFIVGVPYYYAAPAAAYVPAYASAYSAGPALLYVEADPADAQVFVDGQLVGSAGQVRTYGLQISPGHHRLEILAPGFKPFTAEFTATPAFPARVRVALAPE